MLEHFCFAMSEYKLQRWTSSVTSYTHAAFELFYAVFVFVNYKTKRWVAFELAYFAFEF
jgi:hypothetical protein